MTTSLFERIEAIFYDFDGTLVDSLPLQHLAHHLFFSRYGCPISRESWQEDWIRKQQGKRDFIKRNRFQVDLETARREVKRIYTQLAEEKMELRPGAREIVNYAQAKYRQAVCSSSDQETIERFLHKFNLSPCFEAILSDRQLAKPKPDPEIYLKAAERFNLSPSACLVIEDSVIGFTAAARAGMRCAVFLDPYSGLSERSYLLERKKPILFLASLEELIYHL